MRILHTMIRVGNLDRSIAFYTEILGMQLLRRSDYPEGRFTLAFVGYGPESEGAVLELTHNWDTTSYDIGTGYGHVALAVPDAAAACAEIKARGGKVVREGVGQSFFYYGPSSTLVAVPVASRDRPFMLETVTADFQGVTVQGQVTFRIGDPHRTAALMDFSLAADGVTYQSEDPKRLGDRVALQV